MRISEFLNTYTEAVSDERLNETYLLLAEHDIANEKQGALVIWRQVVLALGCQDVVEVQLALGLGPQLAARDFHCALLLVGVLGAGSHSTSCSIGPIGGAASARSI